jgi:hypothetical protein
LIGMGNNGWIGWIPQELLDETRWTEQSDNKLMKKKCDRSNAIKLSSTIRRLVCNDRLCEIELVESGTSNNSQ